jgi:cell division septum initiation protein DivIVA
MNAAAVLSLIGDLYAQIEALQKENEATLQTADELNAKVLDMQKSFDPLGGPEEAAALARKEAEG